MGSIAEAAPKIIRHYACRGLAMQPTQPLRLGIKDVRFYSGLTERVTVTLTDGTKERWTYRTLQGWVKE